MPAIMCGNAAGDVAFMEPAVLSRPDWRGKSVGPQSRSGIAHHSAELTENMCREDVSVRNLSKCFATVTVLTLARSLLQDFVWNRQSRTAFVGVNTRVVRSRPLVVEHS